MGREDDRCLPLVFVQGIDDVETVETPFRIRTVPDEVGDHDVEADMAGNGAGELVLCDGHGDDSLLEGALQRPGHDVTKR